MTAPSSAVPGSVTGTAPSSPFAERLPPARLDCPPLALPAKTERRELPPRGKYDARISYLYMTSAETIVDDEINHAIASDLAELRRTFIKSADLAIAESKGDPEPLTRKRVGFDITCDKAGSTTTMLSIVCKRYTYLGGPYPNVDHITYNFGLCAGQHAVALTLGALCRPDAQCEKTILDLLNRELSARNVEVKLDEHAEALKTFAITQAGLRFFANDDLPHVIESAGTIDIAFAQLWNVLRGDGPLAGLVAP